MTGPLHHVLESAALLVCGLLAACGPSPGDGEDPPTCGVAPVVFDPGGDVLQGGDDSGACARLERRPVGEPDVMYKEYPYQPLRLVAGAGELFVDVSDAAALQYLPTHHNWLDEMSGSAADGTTATVVIRYHTSDGGWTLDLTFTDDAGEQLAGPIELTPAGVQP